MNLHDRIKTEVFAYLRITRKIFLLGTEVYDADIMSYNKGLITEYEIKTSINDLKNEIKNKSKKHKIYASPTTDYFIPNYFYVVVPENLVEKAIKIVNNINADYGIIRWIPGYYPKNSYKIRPCCHIMKRAKPLYEGKSKKYKEFRTAILKRVTSEVLIHRVKKVKEFL